MAKYITKTFTVDGKRYYVRGKTEREAIEKVALKKRDIEEGKVAVSSNMSVSAWAYKAVDTYKTNQEEITKSKYVDRMRHCILEQIGNMPLKSVKPIHCQEVMSPHVNPIFPTGLGFFATVDATSFCKNPLT